jgi:biotin transporter BioY
LAGTLVIYVLGITQLTNFFAANSGLELGTAFVRAVSAGVIPFLPGDALKIIGAILLSTRKQINDVRARITWGSGSRQ